MNSEPPELASEKPNVSSGAGSIPFVAAEPSGPLFADWSPAQWYGARTRWLLEQDDSTRAARVARAAHDAAPNEAAALDALIATSAVRANGRIAYEEGMQLLDQHLKTAPASAGR